MPKLYMMFGLPAAGKSTVVNSLHIKNPLFELISADNFKEQHKDYDPSNPEKLHKYSVEQAYESLFTSVSNGKDIIFDGGGINNHYTYDMISLAIKHSYDCHIIHVNTPLAECLRRNALRERHVPEDAIISKAVILTKCLRRLLTLIPNDNYIRIDYYSNRHAFFDLDGTLAAYQYLPLDIDNGIDFVAGEYFKHALPVKCMINHMLEMNHNSISILSAAPDSNCAKEKIEWLHEYCPNILDDDMYFIGNKAHKAKMLQNLLRKNKLSNRDIILIDDDHNVLDNVNKLGINGVHPSMYLCLQPIDTLTLAKD